MKLPTKLFENSLKRLSIHFAIIAALTGALSAHAQQTYQNIVNAPYRAVSDGPQSAMIVDVKNLSDIEGVRESVRAQYLNQRESQKSSILRELDFMRKYKLIPGTGNLPLVTAAIARSGGRLALPKINRTRAPGDITFSFPTDAAVLGHWSVQQAAQLSALVQLLYPELKSVIGTPLWTGNVTVLNLDPKLGSNDEVLGALLIINGTDVTINFPTFREDQATFLAMAQVMAQSFHGPLRTSYDAWEQGMSRAAAVIAAQDVLYNGNKIDPANGFFYAAGYDLLNQPALGNNTFSPPTKAAQPLVITTLAGMLVPRLQMSSTAWLKCYIEDRNFFLKFNAAYYTAVAADPNVANDTSRLRNLAKGVLPTVELQDFDTWFEQQHVLDTSVTPGAKLFVYAQPTFPDAVTKVEPGAAVFVVYYQTSSVGDEKDLSGTSQVIYWDYSFANRLFLPSFETVTITNGFGKVAPFFVGIGGGDSMRVAMDFPVNSQAVRVYFPAGQTGTVAKPDTFTNFSGTVVGANSGPLTVGFNGILFLNLTVNQGVFGGVGAVPSGFSRTSFVFTPTGATNTVNYQRNVFIRPNSDTVAGVEPLFQLLAPGPSTTLAHLFPAGAQMLSLPITPFSSDIAKTLGADPTKLLLAQYRQDVQTTTTTDRYLRYPSLPLYQPGYGLWGSFPASGLSVNLVGQSNDIQQDISVPAQFGWVQIGNPYSVNLSASSQIFTQYLGGDAMSFSDAVVKGLISPGIIAYSPTTGYADITLSAPGSNFPQNTLEPWKGYWIRVLVTEGVTLSYLNPNAPTRKAKFKTRAAANVATDSGFWRVPLTLSDNSGNKSVVQFGQSSKASESFTPSLDVASPPPFTRAALPVVRFIHNDWNLVENGSEFLSDFRRSSSASQWDAALSLPTGEQDYTLTWNDTAKLPRGTRLTLIDRTSGKRQLMNSTSSYSFRAAKDETTRRFQIVAEPRSPSLIQVQNLRVEAGNSRSVGLSVAFELSAAAETTVEIQLNGRSVRRLTQGRAASVGTNQMLWDLKDDQGRSLPGGLYRISVTARTPEGAQTRQIIPALITR